jgi:asparagine synthetase B (glutamine-hydrolysing)
VIVFQDLPPKADVERLRDRLSLWVARRTGVIVGAQFDQRCCVMLTRPSGKELNPAEATFMSDDRRVSAAEGYLYESDPAGDMPHLLGYLRSRDGGIDWPVGHFAAVHFERSTDTVTIVVDRYGLKPLFEASYQGATVFSQDFGLIADNFPIDRSLDRFAAAQLIGMELIAGNNTLLNGVRRLQHGTVVTIKGGVRRDRQYWDYPVRTARASANQEDILDAVRASLDDAMALENEKSGVDLVVPLSGGMDSRLILGHMAELSDAPVRSITLDVRRSAGEARFAEQAARAVGGDWHLQYLDRLLEPGDDWKAYVDYVGGTSTIYQAWSTSAYRGLDRARPLRTISGLAFDAQLATNSHFALANELSLDSAMQQLVERYASLTQSPRTSLFSDEFAGQLYDTPIRAIRETISRQADMTACGVADYWLWSGRVKSYTASEWNGHRRYVRVGFPYLHPRVFDLCASIPPEVKQGYGLYAEYFRRRFPALAGIPNGNTGALIGEPPALGHRIRTYSDVLDNYVLRLTGGRVERKVSGYDFAAMFRKCRTYRSAVLGALGDSRVVAEGLISEDGLQQLVARVDHGQNYLFPWLMRLVTLELVLARYQA